jgi:hypothetical protein
MRSTVLRECWQDFKQIEFNLHNVSPEEAALDKASAALATHGAHPVQALGRHQGDTHIHTLHIKSSASQINAVIKVQRFNGDRLSGRKHLSRKHDPPDPSRSRGVCNDLKRRSSSEPGKQAMCPVFHRESKANLSTLAGALRARDKRHCRGHVAPNLRPSSPSEGVCNAKRLQLCLQRLFHVS